MFDNWYWNGTANSVVRSKTDGETKFIIRTTMYIRAVGAATVTTVLTVALFYGKVIIIHVHNNKKKLKI